MDCKFYVPSNSKYGFGTEYLTIVNNSFEYSGTSQEVKWANNVDGYSCALGEIVTEKDAGTYTDTLTATYSGNVDFSVNIPYTYTITPAPIALTVSDTSKIYGDENPGFKLTYAGLKNGETAPVWNTMPTITTEADKQSPCGEYAVNVSDGEATNYEVTQYTAGKLTIGKRELTATAVDTLKTYGDENPEFDVAYTGFVNDDDETAISNAPTATCEATAESGVGTYPITISGGEADNYTFAYEDGTLTVVKRTLTATAGDAERTYGDENPEFDVTYTGFANDDDETAISTKPTATCEATEESNVGTYPITVSGGEADNYTFAYEDGTLTVKPMPVGFKDIYNTATYNDMSVSSEADCFKFVPRLTAGGSPDDFRIEMLALDKDGTHTGHVETVTDGDYAGKYVAYTGPTYAGKYIFNLISNGTNPNVEADPARAYLTVDAAQTNLEWDALETITVNEGETAELGISYTADTYCNFVTDYDDGIVEIYSEPTVDGGPRWYAKGLVAGETELTFGIECMKNEWGFYNYDDPQSLSRTIKVAASTRVGGLSAGAIKVRAHNGDIIIENKPEDEPCSVYDLSGKRLVYTVESVIRGLGRGVYVVVVKGHSHRLVL